MPLGMSLQYFRDFGSNLFSAINFHFFRTYVRSLFFFVVASFSAVLWSFGHVFFMFPLMSLLNLFFNLLALFTCDFHGRYLYH